MSDLQITHLRETRDRLSYFLERATEHGHVDDFKNKICLQGDPEWMARGMLMLNGILADLDDILGDQAELRHEYTPKKLECTCLGTLIPTHCAIHRP